MIDSRITGGLGGAGQGAATGAMVGGVPGAIIGGIAGGIGGILSGGGEDDAKKAAENQAYLIELQAREVERKKKLQMGMVVGETKARTYASNLQDTGSTRKYRNMMESEYRRELAYDRMITKKTAEYALEAGDNAADTISRAGIGSAVQGIGSFGAAYAGGAFGGFGSQLNSQGVASTAAADFRAPASIG